MRRTGHILCAAFCMAGAAHAASAEQVKTYINSGTGFFVDSDGDLVTNKHVVENCQRITVQGSVPTQEVKIVQTDAEHDLALLKADAMGVDAVEFRDMGSPVQKDERVVIVGYPGESFKSGNPVVHEAQILSPKGPQGEGRWLELSDVVEQGNSGGPLFDTTGNVIGVVSAKAVIYTYREDDPQNGTTSNAGIAISLPIVEGFLNSAGILYRTTDAQRYSSTDSIADEARRMIVNVRCEMKTERIP